MIRRIFLLATYVAISSFTFSQTIDLTTLEGNQAWDFEVIDNELFVGASGIWKLNEDRWTNLTSNLPRKRLDVRKIYQTDDFIVIDSYYGFYKSSKKNLFWEKIEIKTDKLFTSFLDVDNKLYCISKYGISYFEDSTGKFKSVTDSLPFKTVASVAFFNEKIWISNWSSGIWTFEPINKNWERIGELERNSSELKVVNNQLYRIELNKLYELDTTESKTNWKALVGKKLVQDSEISGIKKELSFGSYRFYFENGDSLNFQYPTSVNDVITFEGFQFYATNRGIFRSNVVNSNPMLFQAGINNEYLRDFEVYGEMAVVNLFRGLNNWYFTKNSGETWICLNDEFKFPSDASVNISFNNKTFHIVTKTGYFILNPDRVKPDKVFSNDFLTSILFAKDSSILLSGWETIYKLNLIDQNWRKVFSSNESNSIVKELTEYGDTLFAVENSRRLIFSSDFGETWQVFKEEKHKAYSVQKFRGTVRWAGKAILSRSGEVESIPKLDFKGGKYVYIDPDIYLITEQGLHVSKNGGWEFEPLKDIANGVFEVKKCGGVIYLYFNDKIMPI